MVNYGPASKYYDLFGSKEDIAFYKDLAIKHGRRALELGVGTGRVAIELAKAKVNILGIDSSRYMLNIAGTKLMRERAEVRNRLRLKLGDMRKFRLEEHYPFAYLASSTFEHCITEKDQRDCIRSVRDALKIGGVLAFDISQPHADLESSWWIDRKETASEEIVRTIFSRRNLKTNVISVNLFFDVYRNGKMKERYYEYGEAKISPKEEVKKILEEAGLTIIKLYGNFDKSVYSPKSQRIIFVCSKS